MSALRLLALAAIVVWSLFPIALVVIASFKPAIEIFAVPPKLLFTPTLENYAELAARVLARQRGRSVTASAFFMIAIRMFPPIVITLPLFPVVTWIGLEDTHLILILLYATFFVSLGSWIMKAFVDQ